jgi:putative tryptophan/tyrosine transport system substrate-binding protein
MSIHIGRRQFAASFGAAVIAWPFGSLARQRGRIIRIGVLWHASNEQEEEPFFSAFRQGLREAGYIEGQNILLVNTFAAENYERFKENAAELVARNVDILVAVNLRAALAAQSATTTIPIVFILVPDPVSSKLVASFGRPGGNITGLSQMALDLTAKRLEIFKDAIGVSRTALLVNPANPTFARQSIEETQAAAGHLQMGVHPIEARSPGDLDHAFTSIIQQGIGAIIVVSDSMFWNERNRIAELSTRHHLASMFALRDHVDAGGLISYGPSIPALFRRAGTYIDKIIKGEKAAEIPVERPAKFEFVVNLKTAKALGLTISPMVLGRADEVIE